MIPSFFFQPLGPDRFWKSFVDTFVCAQGESALRASPQAGCCRKTICSLRLTRLVNTQGGRWCRMPKALITVFSMPKFSWPNSRFPAKRRLWMRVPLKMVIPSKFIKIHSPDEPENGIIFQESCFETPRRCSCRVFFFGPRSSGRLNDSKVATCQKVGQCESHTGAAWLF